MAISMILRDLVCSAMATSASPSPVPSQVGVYECEVTLKFRLLEESQVMGNRDHLLEMLIDAFSYGSDEFVEAIESEVKVVAIDEVQASPLMRRQLIRLRNLPPA
jgi:hypothetical protein